MLAVVAPGQGSQTPGFLAPWLELPGTRTYLEQLSDAAGLDLVAHGTTSDADTIRDTAVAQPLIVAAGLLVLPLLFPDGTPAGVDATAGHSVGEITAAVVAGVLSPQQAMALVRVRADGMAAAAARVPTGMTAVLGGDRDEVLAAIAKHGLTPANDNGAGQLVAAGTLEQLDAFAADPPARARLRPLQVAGAFHTTHMAPAVEALAAHVAALTVGEPRVRLLSNAEGAAVNGGADTVARLVAQVSSPVRWDLVMATLVDLGVTTLIELPPAGTLTGLARRAMPGVETLALKSPDDLAAARELLGPAADLAPQWRLLAAAKAGTVRRGADAPVGTDVAAGTRLGAIMAADGELPLVASHGGTVIEWLVADGDQVSAGQPLVRLQPEGGHA